MVPHFVNTYGLFEYMFDKEPIKAGHISALNTLNSIPSISTNEACSKSISLAVLIQNIHKPIYLMNLVQMKSDDLLTSLLQVYITLFLFSKQFTHYDLHWGNVLLYAPKDNHYIHYHYIINGVSISFKSLYMVKIIDYGRSYIPLSQHQFKNMSLYCQSHGFTFFDPPSRSNYYISSNTRNMSHDLRLLHEFKNKIPHDSELTALLSQVHYAIPFGTPEHVSVLNSNKIYNVTDAFNKLHSLFKTRQSFNTTSYASKTKLGDLHIELGTPARFIPL